jgi:hypothetical protein
LFESHVALCRSFKKSSTSTILLYHHFYYQVFHPLTEDLTISVRHERKETEEDKCRFFFRTWSTCFSQLFFQHVCKERDLVLLYLVSFKITRQYFSCYFKSEQIQ